MTSLPLCHKTIVTPIMGNEIKFNRNYTYNKTFVRESLDLINNLLEERSQRKLSKITVSFLSNPENEDELIRLRNWVIFYNESQSEADLNEFFLSMENIAESILYDDLDY